MASWLVHLRVADKLLIKIEALSVTQFIMGNIAPDSGVPNKDWSVFVPSSKISHFQELNSIEKCVIPERFVDKYLLGKTYEVQALSFYLGYYTHLLTDVLWKEKIVGPCKAKYATQFSENAGFMWGEIKRDWSDLDHLHLKRHCDFNAYRIYETAKGFENTYMDEFSRTAFSERQEYITEFYNTEHENIEREYTYLSENMVDSFVNETADELKSILRQEFDKHIICNINKKISNIRNKRRTLCQR